MELDLQSFFKLHVHNCTNWLREKALEAHLSEKPGLLLGMAEGVNLPRYTGHGAFTCKT